MYGYFSTVQQAQMTHESQEAALRAASDARKAQAALETMRLLEEKIDRLALVCRAMWELVRETSGLNEQLLIEKVSEVDLLDGAKNGKVVARPTKCPRCHRVMSRRLRRCLYCKTQEPLHTAFDSI